MSQRDSDREHEALLNDRCEHCGAPLDDNGVCVECGYSEPDEDRYDEESFP